VPAGREAPAVRVQRARVGAAHRRAARAGADEPALSGGAMATCRSSALRMRGVPSRGEQLRPRVLIAIACALAPLGTQAHHSAIRFDLTIRDNHVTGIVKEFVPANPHTKIVLEVTDDKGTRDIEF